MNSKAEAPEAAAVPANYNAHLFVYSSDKAGMGGVDKSQQAKVIYEMSKGSAFFKNAVHNDQQTEKRLQAMLQKLESATTRELEACRLEVEQMKQRVEGKRDLTRLCCVLDMDMFYAAVEIRDAPQLRDLPVAVGNTSMICTTNYVARKFGVRAAMPGFIGKRLCPQLIFVEPNFEKYTRVAEDIRKVCRDFLSLLIFTCIIG